MNDDLKPEPNPVMKALADKIEATTAGDVINTCWGFFWVAFWARCCLG
jgi:hypothetical protein